MAADSLSVTLCADRYSHSGVRSPFGELPVSLLMDISICFELYTQIRGNIQ